MNCAACDKAGESLKLCANCEAVGYCNKACKKKHHKTHRKECKRKELDLKAQRVAATKLDSLGFSDAAGIDDPTSDLWKSSPLPECPICMLQLPLDPYESVYMGCCGKIVCGECDWKSKETNEENNIARRANVPLDETYAFCRKPVPSCTEEVLKQLTKRMEMNDSEAWLCMASRYVDGEGVPKDERKEFECVLHAAELGNADAYNWLAIHYSIGNVVDADKLKYKDYLQLAAMGGHVSARHYLGVLECENGHDDTAIRHWQISAGAGLEVSVSKIRKAYSRGVVSKNEFEETLRTYQAAREELKNEDRDRFLAEKGEK